MEKFLTLSSRVIPFVVNDIDTDQIIPARFLKITDKAGLGEKLFSDWRYNADGSEKEDFILNKAEYKDAKVLLAGDNFGCGSSREHAPWALMGYGVKAVIATSFADIFRNNALKNGLLPVVVDTETHQLLVSVLEEIPHAEVEINLPEQSLKLPTGHTIEFPIDSFSKACLENGTDELGYLLSFMDEILAFEKALEYS